MKYIGYVRVSTTTQGLSGIGLQAQRETILRHCDAYKGTLLEIHTEVVSGARNDRAVLIEALRRCRATNSTLVVARLDRLSRRASFLLALRDSRANFVCCDMPDANPTTIGIMAILAQYERERISANTRAALGVLKSRGVKLGGVRPGSHKFSQADSEKGARTRIASYKDHLEGLRPEIEIQAKRRKATQKERARALNKSGCLTWSGKRWDAASYVRAVKSLGLK